MRFAIGSSPRRIFGRINGRLRMKRRIARFSEALFGKKVAVVGPAWSVHGSRQGQEIDSHDLVMRFNSALPVPSSAHVDIGQRTDILCNCLHPGPIDGGLIDPVLWQSEGVSWVLSPYPPEAWFAANNIADFERENGGRIYFIHPSGAWYFRLERMLKTRPNSGLLGILFLLRFPLRSLFITGITFGRGGYHPGYKPGISAKDYERLANSDIHQQGPQEALLRAVVARDRRIRTDAVLADILQGRM